MTEKKPTSRRLLSEDLDRLLKEAWSKVVEYASIGTEEASRMSAAAKVRVDIETLKYRRGKLLRTLGERYFRSCGGDPDKGVDGTRETMRQISGLNRDIAELEADLAEVRRKRSPFPEPSGPAAKPDTPATHPPTPPTEPQPRQNDKGRRAARRGPSS